MLLLKRPGGYRIRLIDLDSGFLKDDPPQNQRDLEGDPVYLSPEAFLYMAGQDAPLGPKLDTFAFGALIHRVWTGELPAFDHAKYTYLYEAALDGGDITLSPALPGELRDAVLRMLDPIPDHRPEDGELTQAAGRFPGGRAAAAGSAACQRPQPLHETRTIAKKALSEGFGKRLVFLCLSGMDSLALQRVQRLAHGLQEGRMRPHGAHELLSGHAVGDGYGEGVDHVGGPLAHELRAQHAAVLRIHNHLMNPRWPFAMRVRPFAPMRALPTLASMPRCWQSA